jgi:hypothetical protein
MGLSSRFFSSLAVAISSFALLTFGLSGTAISQTATGSATTLPGITVEAPRQVARAKHRAISRSAVLRQTSPTLQTATATPGSDLARLARLERIKNSCIDGCMTSLKYGNSPWNGCNVSAWPALSSTCRNVANYKSYLECREDGRLVGTSPSVSMWYCSSLAVKYAWVK